MFFLLSIRSLQRWEAANKGIAEGVDEGVDAFDVDDQWEQMDEYLEYVDLLSHHLLILTFLDLLPNSPKVCLNRLAEKGVGYYREQIGAWIAIALPTADELISLDDDSLESASLSIRILKAMKRHLPHSLKLELLLADAAWECASAWFKDETRRVTKLSSATLFLEKLNKIPRLQHGLALMIWETFILQPFQRFYTFLNHHDGRLPRERESRNELLVSETGTVVEAIMHPWNNHIL